MASLYAQVLPFALGAAVSPTLLTVELLVLTGKNHPKARAWWFVIGATAVLLAFGYLCLTVFRHAGDANGGPVSTTSIVIKAVVTLALVGLGIRALRPKKTAGEHHQSRVQKGLATAKLPFFLGVGAISMVLNFSTLVLYLPAVHEITRSTDSVSTKVGAGIMLAVITCIPFWLPVVAVTIVGHRSDAFLASTNAWVTKHSRQVNAGICFVFAVIVGYATIKDLIG